MTKFKIAIISIVLTIALFVGVAKLYNFTMDYLWNDGICYSCEQSEWKFDGVDKGYSQWYCPNCYSTTMNY